MPGPRGLLCVDDHYRTAVPHIYAAGDVIGFPALASTSAKQARVAMSHAFRPGFKTEASPLLPTGIYTIPEAAMVGISEEDLKAKGVDYVVGRASYAESARGEIIGDSTGFLKLIFRRADMTLLGVHVIGEQATELVHIGLMGMLTGCTVRPVHAGVLQLPHPGRPVLCRCRRRTSVSEPPDKRPDESSVLKAGHSVFSGFSLRSGRRSP